MTAERTLPVWRRIVHGAFVAIGAFGLAGLCFLVLPVLQAISATPVADLTLTAVDTALLPPPPATPAAPPPPAAKSEAPEPPQLTDAAPPLDLAQLELALSPGLGAFDGAGDFAVRLTAVTAAGDAGAADDEMFSLADLDQKPRPLFQQQPALTAALRKKLPATVYVLFTVDASGRVEDATVQSSTDPLFEPAVLAAVRQWKFEPGQRGGQPVRFRVRQPFSFQ
ncbi:MAG: energy transducer TonB [Planctomycetota bacterium]